MQFFSEVVYRVLYHVRSCRRSTVHYCNYMCASSWTNLEYKYHGVDTCVRHMVQWWTSL